MLIVHALDDARLRIFPACAPYGNKAGPLPIRLILNARGGAAKSAPLCTAFEVASETLVFTTLTLDLPNDLAPVALHAVAVGKVRIIGADRRHACLTKLRADYLRESLATAVFA